MNNLRALLVVLFAGGAGCAGMFTPLEKQPDFGQYFTMRMSDNTEQAKLEGTRLHGADLEVTHTNEGFRGNGPTGVIDLRTSGNKIAGSVGTGSTELFVEEKPGALVVRGRFAEKLSDLELSTDRVKGTIGRCQYDLQRPNATSPWYEGQRACGGTVASVQLALPAALPSLPAADRAVLLSVFLASESGRKHEAGLAPRSSMGDPRDAARRTPMDGTTSRVPGQ